ncbi:uncharacterized protein LOC113791167 [Dermatophagoides pteronyssinus]|uniref:uncharacterized protein LOC113791167 n=1 Tax=Dermatophagoides pteronyssinus TaxID=6956 RepID=UPI003F67BCE2
MMNFGDQSSSSSKNPRFVSNNNNETNNNNKIQNENINSYPGLVTFVQIDQKQQQQQQQQNLSITTMNNSNLLTNLQQSQQSTGRFPYNVHQRRSSQSQLMQQQQSTINPMENYQTFQQQIQSNVFGPISNYQSIQSIIPQPQQPPSLQQRFNQRQQLTKSSPMMMMMNPNNNHHHQHHHHLMMAQQQQNDAITTAIIRPPPGFGPTTTSTSGINQWQSSTNIVQPLSMQQQITKNPHKCPNLNRMLSALAMQFQQSQQTPQQQQISMTQRCPPTLQSTSSSSANNNQQSVIYDFVNPNFNPTNNNVQFGNQNWPSIQQQPLSSMIGGQQQQGQQTRINQQIMMTRLNNNIPQSHFFQQHQRLSMLQQPIQQPIQQCSSIINHYLDRIDNNNDEMNVNRCSLQYSSNNNNNLTLNPNALDFVPTNSNNNNNSDRQQSSDFLEKLSDSPFSLRNNESNIIVDRRCQTDRIITVDENCPIEKPRKQVSFMNDHLYYSHSNDDMILNDYVTKLIHDDEKDLIIDASNDDDDDDVGNNDQSINHQIESLVMKNSESIFTDDDDDDNEDLNLSDHSSVTLLFNDNSDDDDNHDADHHNDDDDNDAEKQSPNIVKITDDSDNDQQPKQQQQQQIVSTQSSIDFGSDSEDNFIQPPFRDRCLSLCSATTMMHQTETSPKLTNNFLSCHHHHRQNFHYHHERRSSISSNDSIYSIISIPPSSSSSSTTNRNRSNTISVTSDSQSKRFIKFDRYKTELCIYKSEIGECPYGDQCCFAHGQDEIRPRPLHDCKERTQPCESFSKDVCYRGSSRCWYLHPKSEYNFERLKNNLQQWLFKQKFQPELFNKYSSDWFEDDWNPKFSDPSNYQSIIDQPFTDDDNVDFGDKELDEHFAFHRDYYSIYKEILKSLSMVEKKSSPSSTTDILLKTDDPVIMNNYKTKYDYPWPQAGTNKSDQTILHSFYSVPFSSSTTTTSTTTLSEHQTTICDNSETGEKNDSEESFLLNEISRLNMD